MASEAIDDLLVRYLGLLDEYTRLRALLTTHQAAMYGHLARANFSAERGFRYGQNHYDGRMQATARLAISEAAQEGSSGEEAPSFVIARLTKPAKPDTPKGEASEEKEDIPDEKKKTIDNPKDAEAKKSEEKRGTAAEVRPPRDPLQWFGVLTPMALRQAQKEAIDAVDVVIPRLASLSAEMAAVEIEVRRSRKKRAKAAAAQAKETTKIPVDGAETAIPA